MNKLEFISRQFSKAEKKRFEHYVVTRIWHLLDDLSIKFVTQQYVTRPNGRALTDMFFPQLQIHIEIDEGHHKKQIEWDKLREADIINATGHEVFRVDVTKDIATINNEISQIVERLKIKKSNTQNYKSWDIEAELNPQTYIDKGFIDLNDDCAFRRIVDALNCFGIKYERWQKGGALHPKENGKVIWFPKLYKNKEWHNSISDDETEIREISIKPEVTKSHIDKFLKQGCGIRIVFAKVKSPLGGTMFRFKGEYEFDKSRTNYTDGLFFRRISERVNTYPS